MPQEPNPAPDPGSEPGHPADAQPAGHGPAAPRATAFPSGTATSPPPPQASHDQLNELLATIAHELRRPLAALLGILATLQHRGDALPPGDRDELFAVARRQGDQLTSLLDQLRLTAHPPAGPPLLPLIDAAEVARQAGQVARLAFADHPVTVDVTGPLPVQADPLAIGRILGNLLDNAAKYAHGPTPIRLAAARDGAWAVLVVEDAGPGIPAGQRKRLFEPYVRLDPAASSHDAGLGLGLHIARRLARANHGDVRVGDPGGRGARFELHLPLAGHRSAGPPAAP